MKVLFRICLCTFLLFGCKKDEDPVPATMAEELKTIIKNENVSSVMLCCVGCTCFGLQSSDYSFPTGDMIRVNKDYRDLHKLDHYSIEGSPKIMTLYFSK